MPALQPVFLFCEARARQGIPPCGMTQFRFSGKPVRRSLGEGGSPDGATRK